MKIRLYDSAFLHCRYSNGPRALAPHEEPIHKPAFLRWERGGINGSDTEFDFITDSALPHYSPTPGRKAVAWLLEPHELNPSIYRWVRDNREKFHAILSHDVDFWRGETSLDGFSPNGYAVSNFVWVPFGGCWIPRDKWWDGDYGKVRPLNDVPLIVASDKRITEGHKMRHEIIQRSQDDTNFPMLTFGRGYRHFEKKEDLPPHRFQVVVENSRRRGYFTEKLIDCLVQGIIPIYWGCPDLASYGIDPDGVFQFNSVDHLFDEVLPRMHWVWDGDGREATIAKDALNRAVLRNRFNAERYVLAEDYIHSRVLPQIGGPVEARVGEEAC